jgi:SagB-type dehydrogenase family enzyme
MLNSLRISLPKFELNLSQPTIDLLVSKSQPSVAKPNLAAIASLLALSVGFRASITGTETRRWTPTGGNLGSVEAYLVARDVEGLATGVYFYRPEEHVLVLLNQRHTDHVASVLNALQSEDFSPALIILVGAYKRISRKYGAFGYKLMHFDAGVACNQIHLIASALRVRMESVVGWNSRLLAQALVLRPFHEVPVHVFRFGSTPGTTTSPHRSQMATNNYPALLDGDRNKAFSSLTSDLLVEELMQEDVLVRERLPSHIEPYGGLIKTLLSWRAAGEKKQMTLAEALSKRKSVRDFSAEGVNKANIRSILRSALGNNVSVGSRLAFTVLIQRSDDFRSGVYQYIPESDSLIRTGHAFSPKRFAELFIQPGCETAPLVIWISGDLSQPSAICNGGYQTCLVRSGFLGHRLWVASIAVGMSGVLLAGISPEATEESAELTEAHHSSFLAFVCGYPKS